MSMLTPDELLQLAASLTEYERAILDLLTQENPIWLPLPGPQTEAFLSEADETFYGGAPGGGKTDLAIGLGVTLHHRTLILRREFPQARSIIDRAVELIGSLGRLNENAKIYRLNDGRAIEYGSCVHEKDKAAFKGRPHDLKVFDEVTEFTKTQYEFIIRWNRSAKKGQRCRILCTFNPPTTAEGRWVIEYLAPWLDKKHPNPAKPGELRWFAVIDDKVCEVPNGEPFEHKGETIYPRSRTFIPARVTDNPFLATDKSYIANLQSTTGVLRKQLLHGDMEAGEQDHEWQVIPTAWIRAAQERWKEGRPKDAALCGIGIDVARGGADDTVLARGYGNWIDELVVIPGRLTPTGDSVVAEIEKLYDSPEDHGRVPECIDVVGVGAAPYDAAHRREHRIYGIHASGASTARIQGNRYGFVNVRAELYWKLGEALDPEGDIKLAIPPDPLLEAELVAHRYEVVPGGIRVLSKDKGPGSVKEILGRSPDRAEALVLCVKAMKKLQ